MFSHFAEDASTLLRSELTADTSPGRYIHSHDDEDATTHYEEFARITGFDVDYTNSDDLTFPGFRPMRHYLSSETAKYLVSELRWSREGDPRGTIGQKNVIIIFVCIATIEDCLVDEETGDLLPVTEPFDALLNLLGMRNRIAGLPRTYKFLSTIRRSFVNSRAKEIRCHLEKGNRPPPEPSDLSGLGKMLLDVMDRHIAFLRTKKPLTRHPERFPFDRLLELRLIQIKNQLRDRTHFEKCFTTFVPTIPVDQQAPWPRGGMAVAWEAAQAKLNAAQLDLDVDLKPAMHPEHGQTTKKVPIDARNTSRMNSDFIIPGIPADGPTLPLQTAPNSSAGHPDTGHTDALSGLQLFKTTACQVHKIIRDSRDSSDFRDFIGRVEHDIQQFEAKLPVGADQPTAGPDNGTGILGSELDMLLERHYIRSLMNIGLGMIHHQWDSQYLTDELRQKILVDITEERRKIKEAADQVCSAGA